MPIRTNTLDHLTLTTGSDATCPPPRSTLLLENSRMSMSYSHEHSTGPSTPASKSIYLVKKPNSHSHSQYFQSFFCVLHKFSRHQRGPKTLKSVSRHARKRRDLVIQSIVSTLSGFHCHNVQLKIGLHAQLPTSGPLLGGGPKTLVVPSRPRWRSTCGPQHLDLLFHHTPNGYTRWRAVPRICPQVWNKMDGSCETDFVHSGCLMRLKAHDRRGPTRRDWALHPFWS